MTYYSIKQLDATGLVKTVYTPCKHGKWKYGESGAIENYIELSNSLFISPDDMVRPSQTHTTTIQIVDSSNAGDGVVRPPNTVNCDGLITNTKRLFLCTREADCVPVYILDPVNIVVSMVHSGWRGTAGEIVLNSINMMQMHFNSNPKDLLIAFGPNICKNCYEVGPELIDSFSIHFSSHEISSIFKRKNNGKYLLDVSLGIKISLLRCGVNEKNIFESNICTFEDLDFSSYRRNHTYDNHMLTGIMIK